LRRLGLAVSARAVQQNLPVKETHGTDSNT
jgi:hypothetical protein